METALMLEPEEIKALKENGLLEEISPYYNDTYLITQKAQDFLNEKFDNSDNCTICN